MHRRLLELIYEVAYLEARDRAGMHLGDHERQRLASLAEVLCGDPGYERRRHRRLPLNIEVTLRAKSQEHRAELEEISAGGASVRGPRLLLPESHAQLKISVGGQAHYVFPCKVLRASAGGDGCQLALAFEGIPLQLRMQRRQQSAPTAMASPWAALTA